MPQGNEIPFWRLQQKKEYLLPSEVAAAASKVQGFGFTIRVLLAKSSAITSLRPLHDAKDTRFVPGNESRILLQQLGFSHR